MPTPAELEQAQHVLHACGLRFDGYAYAESATAPERSRTIIRLTNGSPYAENRPTRGEDASAWLANMRDTFTQTLAVPQEIEVGHAALFAFQRGAKDLGWFLDRTEESLAGPLLFLHLYALPTPPRWRSQDYAADWERFSAEEVETAAAIVRRWLALPEEP